MENQVELWKAYSDFAGIEVSTLGRVRTLDKMISNEKITRFTKGRVLKQHDNGKGYLTVGFQVNGKQVTKRVHRLVAQTFIPNPDGSPQVNHMDCDRRNNNIDNLEWCDNSYNVQYREKFGKAQNKPVFAINLATLEVSQFRSQGEASRALGIGVVNINNIIKGKQKTAYDYWFKEDDGNGIEIDKDKLNDIMDGMHLIQGVFAVNLKTQEVSKYRSQHQASRTLGINQGNISNVIKGRQKKSHGYWFVNADDKAVDIINQKLHDIGKTELKI